MTTPRHQLVDAEQPGFYNISSRCVRRAFLCGFDRFTGKNYNYRKAWLVDRMKLLGTAFSIEIFAYALMSNHFHLVLYYDPTAPDHWDDLDVVNRWLKVCPVKCADGSVNAELTDRTRTELLSQPEKIAQLRRKLGSLSTYMKLLKQPIARRANREDGVTGHFFEQRFYSATLLSDQAVTCAMAYVDLNPVRAKVSRTIWEYRHTSISERTQSQESKDSGYLKPIVSGLNRGRVVEMTLSNYVDHLEVLTRTTPNKSGWPDAKLRRWRAQTNALAKRQRMYGPLNLIQKWANNRGWQLRELPLPE